MFTKKPDKDAAAFDPTRSPPAFPQAQPPAAPPPQPMRATAPARSSEKMKPSSIGSDLVITGNLDSKGEVEVDGEIQGDLRAQHIVVGERAKITGGLIAEDVVVRGHVMGSIRGVRVTLQASSHVEGDIYHKSLAIEQGAFFEGKSRRSENPLDANAKADTMAPPINGVMPVPQS